MQISLGPVLFNWAADKWRDFYFRIADEAPVDAVVVGEIVCSKRAPFFEAFIPEVIERLRAAGKEVLLGSLILVSTRRERQLTRALAEMELPIEVNDLTALRTVAGRPHALGPFVNVYNEDAARYHAKLGARRIVLPPELPLASMAAIAAALSDVLIEAFAFGRMPLAISARCYHARVQGLAKDNCRFVCDQDPDGLPLQTLDGADFLTINGVQTLSHRCASLIGDIGALRAAGVGSLRLSPQDCDMVGVAKLFRDCADGRIEGAEAADRLGLLYDRAPFANGFLHGRAGVTLDAPSAGR